MGKCTHGMSGTRIYELWCRMKGRCNNPKTEKYYCYGGRCITVCDDWQKDFLSFYDWSIFNGYQNDLTIDRINNNGNYEPDNCRWTTQKVQCNNSRKNHLITINGVTKTPSQWADETGIGYRTIRSRYEEGKTGEDIIKPRKKNPILLTINGITKCLKDWARYYGVTYDKAFSRYKSGYSVNDLFFTGEYNKWTGKKLRQSE